MFNNRITYRDEDQGVNNAIMEAYKQSENPYEQFLWLKNNKNLTDQQSVHGMVDLVQQNFNAHTGKKVSLTDGEIDLIMRGFKDALKHMQKNLPQGVYNYIKYNIEDTLEKIIKDYTT